MVRVRIEDLEEYAKKYNIPIMLPDGIAYLTDYIKKNQVKTILEIGSAIGYSAIKMALVDPKIHVTTIERDQERYKLACQNIREFGVEQQITILYADAFDVELAEQYDLIFIDAAKSQYIKFFEKFKKNLKEEGTIISDNLEFHGLVHTKEKIESRNVRQLVRKINAYITFLEENKEFTTTFLPIGDGIGISRKKSQD